MSLPPPSSHRAEAVTHTLVITNRYEELETLSVWINSLAEQLGLSARGTFRLELALTETVTNIIEHAHDDDLDHDITIKLQYHDHTLSVQVIDTGTPFDPLQVPEPARAQTLEEAEIGGLGIHLVRNYADQCDYQRLNEKNILTMLFDDQPAQNQ